MADKKLKTAVEINTQVKNLGDLNKMIDGLENAGQNVDFLRLRSEVLAKEWDRLNPKEQAQRIRQIKNAAIEASTGTDTLSNSTKTYGTSANKAKKSTEELGQSTDRLGKVGEATHNRLKQLAVGLASYFSIKAIGGFFKSAISGAASLEEQLDKVQAVSGATNTEMAKIAQVAKELGASTKYTATQAAEGFEILARAGLDASESIEALPNVLALAQGSGLELSEAAGYITKAVAGMNLEMSDSGRVADVLAKAAASANTDVSGLGQALSYAAPSAAALGVSLEETVAIIGKFADAGIDASRAGTALNSIMAQFSNPASKFRQELQAIGINTNNFSQALEQLAQSGDKGQQAILAVGQEAGPALKALLAQGIPALHELQAALENSGGSSQQMADTMNNNLLGAVKGLSSVWDTLKNTLGKPFLAPITARVKELSTIIKDFVDSGKIEALGKAFAESFDQMLGKALAFIKRFKLDEVKGEISDFTESVATKLEKLSAVLGGIYNTFATFGNVMKTGTYAIGNAFSQLGADIAGVVPGLDSVSNSLQQFAEHTAEKVVTSAQDLIDSSTRLRSNFTTLTTSTEKLTEAADKQADATTKQATSTQDLTTLTKENVSVAKEQTAVIKDQAQALDDAKAKAQAYEQAWAAVGLSQTEMLSGLSQAEQKIIDSTQTAIEGLQKTANGAEQTGQAIDRYLVQALDKIKTPEGLTAFIAELQALPQQTVQVQAAIAAASEKLWQHNEVYKTLSDSIAKATDAEQLKQYATAVEQAYQQGEISIEQYQAVLEKAGDKEKALAQSSEKTAAATEKKAQATKKVAEATEQTAKATEKAAKANQAQADSAEASAQAIEKQATASYRLYDAAGKTAEQLKHLHDLQESANRQMNEAMILRNQASLDMAGQAERAVRETARAMEAAEVYMRRLNAKMSDGSLRAEDLADSFGVATGALVKLDQSTLNRLNATIEKARQKIKGLADEARATADDLEAELARLQGDDTLQKQLEQKRKMGELEEKLATARARHNQEEIEQYERAMQLQQQIFAEKQKQQAAQEQARARQQQERSQRSNNNSSSSSSNNSSSSSAGNAAMGSLVIQVGEKNIPIERVSQDVMQQISSKLRQFQRGNS